jgi:rhodanese-related sulfurtransferase
VSERMGVIMFSKGIPQRLGLTITWQMGTILLLATFLGLMTNLLRSHQLPLVANWSPEGQLSAATGGNLSISPEDAEALFHERAALFLDARSRELYEEGRIHGALNLPWEEFDERSPDVLPKVPQDMTIVTYCDGESCNLGKELAFALLDLGYSDVRVLVNGWTVWQEKHLPVDNGLAAASFPDKEE